MRFPKDKVKFSKKTTKQVSQRPMYLAERVHKNIMFTLSHPSKIESGIFVLMFTAIARQCSVYRTHFVKRPPSEKEANKLLVKWIKTLPVDDIK